MAKFSVSGSGHNSLVSLGAIHIGNCSFRKDTNTTHEQVKLLQQELTNQGYNTQGADGKFGSNTETQVKKFQKDYGLTADGYFGKKSLLKLEELKGNGTSVHLDNILCHEGDKIDNTKPSGEYKTMNNTDTKRVNSYSDAVQKIVAYTGGSLSVAQYESNLERIASDLSISYNDLDCSGFTKRARNGCGTHGSTTNLCSETVYFGHIENLGGFDNLIEGMELFQGCRKTANGNIFWTSHIGVYAGKRVINGKLQHAVWQSSDGYGNLDVKYNKDTGPNLTALSDNWNYWGWSKYVNYR